MLAVNASCPTTSFAAARATVNSCRRGSKSHVKPFKAGVVTEKPTAKKATNIGAERNLHLPNSLALMVIQRSATNIHTPARSRKLAKYRYDASFRRKTKNK